VTIGGIPIPFTSPLLLGLVHIHILFGLASVVAGIVAMLSTKGRGRHSRFGTIYFWCLAAVFATSTALSVFRWRQDHVLFVLGALAFTAALFGRTALRRRWRGWPRVHISGMGASYVLLLTAFYVDNGKNLPFWRDLPEIAYWIVPTAAGLPLIAWALLRHPIVRGGREASRIAPT